MADDALREELFRSEVALASRDGAGLAGALLDLIADDFVEFGSSGRVWDAAFIRESLAASTTGWVEIVDFVIDELADGVVLATYRVIRPAPSNRSSVWVRRDGRWMIRFHQGTPAG
jgi:hypothetical protein